MKRKKNEDLEDPVASKRIMWGKSNPAAQDLAFTAFQSSGL